MKKTPGILRPPDKTVTLTQPGASQREESRGQDSNLHLRALFYAPPGVLPALDDPMKFVRFSSSDAPHSFT